MAARVGERYELLEEIGRGGMGTVFAGRDLVEGRPCAIKVLREDTALDPQGRERFEREARTPQRIGHPGLVQVYDAFVDEKGRMVLVMELLRGESLREILGGSAPMERKLAVILGALEPLAAVHGAGYVHRDLKPDNIFVATDGDGVRRVMILDFGIVRDTRATVLTQTGVIVGSVDYISPEQAHSAREVLPSSDVFSVGVVLYEICAGERPFQGDSPIRTLGNLAAGRFQPLDDRVDAPRALIELVHECLSFDPAARPANAAVVRDRLAPLVDAPLPSSAGDRLTPGEPSDSVVRPVTAMPRVRTPMESAQEGRRARGATFLEAVKALKHAMRSGLQLALSGDEREWLDERVLVSSWYPFEYFEWVTRLLHERVLGGSDRGAIKMGRLAADALLTGIHSRFVYPGDVPRTFRSAPNAWSRYFDFGEVVIEMLGPKEVQVCVEGYAFAPPRPRADAGRLGASDGGAGRRPGRGV